MTPIDDRGPGTLARNARWFAVAFVTLVALWLRLSGLTESALWLDEILGVRGIGPEHGPIYYAVLRHAAAIDPIEWGARLPFLVAGVAAVPLTYLLGLYCGGWVTGLLASLLLALSPAHIHYSREARPYALLVTAGVAGFLAVVWAHRRGDTPMTRMALAAALVTLILLSANGLFYAVPLLLAPLVVLLVPGHRQGGLRSALLTTVVLAAIVVGVFMLSYPSLASTAGSGAWTWQGRTGGPARLAQSLVSGIDVVPPTHDGLAVASALAVLGAWHMGRQHLSWAVLLSFSALTGFILPVLMLLRAEHFLSVRYVLPALVPLAILTSAGVACVIGAATSILPLRWRFPATLVSVVLVAGAAGAWQAEILADAQMLKADWRRVASFLQARARPGQVVIVSNDWSEICLEFYLRRIGADLPLMNAKESLATAKTLAADRAGVFLVAGGYSADRAVRDWMRAHHLLLSSPVEAISVSFYPDREAYLASGAASADVARDARVFWNTLGGRLLLDTNSEPFLVSGWSGAERGPRGDAFRWMAGARAVVYVPAGTTARQTVALTVMPYQTLAGRQRLRLIMNERIVHERVLPAGWSDIRVPIEADDWRPGANLLILEASETDSPSRTGVADARQLSVCVQQLSFEE